ncbi:MAG: hypothetical protein DRG25_03975 [Deltaproteobacteria bacterium]|nr:MAG: hypothetical protein DRG25_03975 [Deltaproteobacteria bacterium]
MELKKACEKTFLFSKDNSLLNQSVETYANYIETIFDKTRLGRLPLKYRIISQIQLKEPLYRQSKGRGFLGEIPIQMGLLRKNKLSFILRIQRALRLQSVKILILESLRLGQILLKSQFITREQLEKALEKQQKSKKLLAKIIFEMKLTSQSTLQALLEFQKLAKKIVVMSVTILLVGGCAGGVQDNRISATYTNSKGKTYNNQSYNYQGTPVPFTPYELKYKRIRDYLKRAHQFKYEAEKKTPDHWQLPEETEKLGKGDCEDKAIWLYCKLLNEGFNDVRLVIGKQREDSPKLHAWVAWYSKGKVYILDPTFDSEMWEIRQYPKGYYTPYYSFYRDKSWTHLPNTKFVNPHLKNDRNIHLLRYPSGQRR